MENLQTKQTVAMKISDISKEANYVRPDQSRTVVDLSHNMLFDVQ